MARVKTEAQERGYKVYITDSIYYRAENKRIGIRWEDTLKPRQPEKSAEEILDDTLKNAGLTLKE